MVHFQIVRPQPGTSSKQGDAITSGTIIKLQHMRTRKWLHSHLHASPITGNLEVSIGPSLFIVCFHSTAEFASNFDLSVFFLFFFYGVFG